MLLGDFQQPFAVKKEGSNYSKGCFFLIFFLLPLNGSWDIVREAARPQVMQAFCVFI